MYESELVNKFCSFRRSEEEDTLQVQYCMALESVLWPPPLDYHRNSWNKLDCSPTLILWIFNTLLLLPQQGTL